MQSHHMVWEPGGTEAQTAAGTARRYRKPLTSFRWCDLQALLSDTFAESSQHNAQRMGASLAFYTALSLAPLLVTLVLNAWVSAMGKLFVGGLAIPEVITHCVNSILSLAVTAALFILIYKVIPDLDLEWRDVALGGLVTALLFTLGHVLIGLYLGKAGVVSAYGAAGSLVLILFWVYYSVRPDLLPGRCLHQGIRGALWR